ncbi:hypothetical protein [Chryseobacterium binzhouense]|uniref:hypothetical protein n=1 Tax=Chryseobacterium binzhouense TaxID=2593646 RepID=UPI00289DA88B|nr:hypothetical protein [Chryseobacterium binzhouense]
MKSSGKEEKFVLKHSGFIKEKFILTNDRNEDLLIFKASYRWVDMIYNYHITSSENFEAIPGKTLLLFITYMLPIILCGSLHQFNCDYTKNINFLSHLN